MLNAVKKLNKNPLQIKIIENMQKLALDLRIIAKSLEPHPRPMH